MPQVDVLVVSADTTSGWRTSARELTGGLERCGVRAQLAETGPVRRVRTFALTDLVEARAVRRLAAREMERLAPRAIVYCSVTAALLWPRPGAIWLDAVAAGNRPGRHGLWQRSVERRRLCQAPLVLAMSDRALDPLASPPPAVVLPVPVEPSGELLGPERRNIAAVVYGGNPEKKRLRLVLEAWDRVRREGETLVVAGAEGPPAPGVRWVGRLPRDEYRALLRRARVFIAAPLVEDYGTAELEALADGCVLVTTPARGGYPALGLARQLDPRLVGADLAPAVRTALDDPRPEYAAEARRLLEPFRREAFDRTLSAEVLPRLLG